MGDLWKPVSATKKKKDYCDVLSHNSENKKVTIARKSQNCKFISRSYDFIYQDCEFVSSNYEKKCQNCEIKKIAIGLIFLFMGRNGLP